MNNYTWIDLEGKTEEVTFSFKLFLGFSSKIVSYRCLLHHTHFLVSSSELTPNC